MSNEELFYLKWNNFQKNIRRMRDEEDLVDITFACEGKKIGAHKLVLFSCSPYFKDLLKDNHSQHPIFFFHDISYDILKAIIEYMYLGEVHITNDNLKDFIRVAEALQIRGLSKDTTTTDELNDDDQLDESPDRKRSNDDSQVQTIAGKRLRIISEAALASALNDDDDDLGDDEVPQIRINSKRDSNVQPKVENLEFLDDPTHLHTATQPTQPSSVKPAQNITYVNIDNFADKTNNTTVTQQQQQQQQPSSTVSQYIQAGTSQQQQQQQQPQHNAVEYKSEDELWVEKAIEQAGGESTPKGRNSSKNSAAYKANCLTPRSCPMCARVYSNVSNLRQHMRLIHNPQAVVCPICQKHFNSDLYLKRHYASIHQANQGGSEGESGIKNESSGSIQANQSNSGWGYQNTDGTIIQQ